VSSAIHVEDDTRVRAIATPDPASGEPIGAGVPIAERRHGEEHRYLIAFAVVLAALMQVIDSSIVNVALPDMMGNLGASLDEIAWVTTGYILASVIVIPLTGWLGQLFGRKRYFIGSSVARPTRSAH
jgi:DHA2 family multidrug resistance protein